MRPLAMDTSIEVERIQVEIMRRMSPGNKLDQLRDMCVSVARMQEARIRTQFPHDSDELIRLRVIARWLPRELMIRAYGWDPFVDGR